MPIKISNDLPASKILKDENIFVMDENRAVTQQIRPLKLLILNIMPTKIITETDEKAIIRCIIDYLSGMSDEYIIKIFNELISF